MTVKLVNRSKTGYIEIQSIEFDCTDIPTEPLPIMAKYIKSVPEGSIERIKKLFDERPVWTRTACMYNLPPKDRKYMKKLLPFVSYYMSTGPWKLAWVRFGFDPKQHKDCRL
ncbi:transcription factor IIIC, subunit 5 [Paraphysoderma sedebokerense]|nr:transcription factor IIIC, subunit 5 [Paraphysoderma sedebokerense]